MTEGKDAWEVLGTNDFELWFKALPVEDAKAVYRVVGLLREKGPTLPMPYSSGINGSRHPEMRELRVRSGRRYIRILYAFDAMRRAILLVGGDKRGQKRWYEESIRRADDLWAEWKEQVEAELRAGTGPHQKER
jgi:hypothetical protein